MIIGKKVRKNSISTRLMVYFVGIILVPIVILSLTMQAAYKKSIMDLAANNAKDSLDLINYNIDQQFKSYDSLAYFISRDRQIQEIGEIQDIGSYNGDSERKEKMYRLLNYYRTSVEQVARVVISYENGFQYSTDQEELIYAEAEAQPWYQLCSREQKTAHVLNFRANEQIYQEMEPRNSEMLIVCRGMFNSRGEYIGAVSVEMYSQVLERSMSNILSRNGSYVYILNKEGKTVYSPVVGIIPQFKKDNIQVEVYNQRNHWQIIGVVPMTEYLGQINTLKSLLAVMLFVITLIMAVVSIQVGGSIVRPIQTLRALMKKAEDGDLTVHFDERAPEEITELGYGFNVMIQQLNNYVKQVYTEQKAKRKAEMEALQANIKPHFLYNTLDTIHWMAKSYHAADIVETIDALSTLFRISLSKGREIITVAQEIQHVTSYLQIQKVRYEEMISYEIHVAKNCEELKVQKLILQPLVENSIYHGIKESGAAGKITIHVWREQDQIFMAVEDNGLGMAEEKLEQVRGLLEHFKPESNGAYGVVNVHQRIVLNYGKPYGLYLESEPNGGTTALICHPVIQED
ncbi:sensor histidine kinase [Lactonifactor longoviformis]|uniref:Two-component system, sensor histidine kinase YesM n=1 Tax=Lactonifactor longoviformis DSM 17459 TaxID=1122155 RepID=A0A1M5ABD9_9CLOT|nr:sensor histidine kinase [Lactonifactor longoviformis]POP34660.1 sensor histidine kinase [Lactonifactor longoviformis]SHF27573.1 two-component system, sensor histidine kinase YesM [Lactonifactor longoviformis DSM 17459]